MPSQGVLAARVLRDASAAASRVPPKTTPSPGQWIYSKLVGYQYPQGTTSGENWITFDGTESAYYESRGAPITVHTSPVAPPADITSDPLAAFNTDATPQTAYYALASLPTAPSQLLATVDKAVEAAAERTPSRATRSRAKRQRTRASSSSTTWACCCGTRQAG